MKLSEDLIECAFYFHKVVSGISFSEQLLKK